MSWPVFITLPNGTRFNVTHISSYQWDRNYGDLNIYFSSVQTDYYRANISAEDLDQLIADAVAATANLVARAEAEAIDEHRADVAKRSEFYTKPAAPVIPELRLQP